MKAITPEEVPDRLVEVAEQHYDMGGAGLIRNVIAGILPVAGEMIHADIAELFRRAAAGRREYAKRMPVRKAGMSVPDAHLAEAREMLLIEAACYESAALIVEDPRRVMDVIPSWRWTDDEAASIRMPEEVQNA